MNTPRRYIAKAVIRPVREDDTYDIEAVQDPNGDWVAYEDYKVIENALRHHIEQEALRKVGEALHQRNIDSGAYNREKNEVIASLQAEVERLRKAGDKLVFALEAMDIIMDTDSEHPEVAEWNAAKEGKPQS